MEHATSQHRGCIPGGAEANLLKYLIGVIDNLMPNPAVVRFARESYMPAHEELAQYSPTEARVALSSLLSILTFDNDR